MNNTITIKIDVDLEEIIPDFLKNRRDDIISIETFLNKNDYDAIRVIGHSMKGSGASYGFHFISEIGKSIEQAAKAGSAQIVADKKAELLNFLDCVRIEYVQE